MKTVVCALAVATAFAFVPTSASQAQTSPFAPFMCRDGFTYDQAKDVCVAAKPVKAKKAKK